MWRMSCIIICVFLSVSCAKDPQECAEKSSCVLNTYCSNDGLDFVSFRRADGAEPCKEKNLVCCKWTNIIMPHLVPSPSHECGVRNIQGPYSKYIVGGPEEADFPEFPWVVVLFQTEIAKLKLIGGGSLLSPSVVLTAAHIISNRSLEHLVARAGDWNIELENEKLRHRDSQVLQKIIHEDFNNTVASDIGLLLLKTPFDLTFHISTICLPRTYEYLDVKRCFVAGWGARKFGNDGVYRNIMRKLILPVVNRSECVKSIQANTLGHVEELHQSLICAGGEGNLDTCKGDGGSPLFCPLADHPNQYFQLGIVAGGIECNLENMPGIYLNVFAMLTWLRDNLKRLNVNPNYFTPYLTKQYFERERQMRGH